MLMIGFHRSQPFLDVLKFSHLQKEEMLTVSVMKHAQIRHLSSRSLPQPHSSSKSIAIIPMLQSQVNTMAAAKSFPGRVQTISSSHRKDHAQYLLLNLAS